MNENANHQGLGKFKWVIFLVGIIALIWNAMGCLNFFMQISPDGLANMPESHQAIARSRPFWVTAAFGVSVISGVLAAVLLLMKKKLSIPLFIVSFVGAVIANLHAIFFGNALNIFSPPEVALGIFGSLVAAALFIWFSVTARNKQWIN